jgi:hypothetical protein
MAHLRSYSFDRDRPMYRLRPFEGVAEEESPSRPGSGKEASREYLDLASVRRVLPPGIDERARTMVRTSHTPRSQCPR